MDYARPVEAVIPGVTGRVLGVLTRTEVELSMRTIADLAGASLQQTRNALTHLTALGLATRHDVGTAALIRLDRDNEAARAVLALSDLRDHVLARLSAEAAEITPAPAALVLFGSFARGEARADSDLDVLAVRPKGVEPDDDAWADTLGHWATAAHHITGNPINLIEVGNGVLPHAPKDSVWRAIADEGVVLIGARPTVRGGKLALDRPARRSG